MLRLILRLDSLAPSLWQISVPTSLARFLIFKVSVSKLEYQNHKHYQPLIENKSQILKKNFTHFYEIIYTQFWTWVNI